MRLQNKVALITGAGSGIGRAIALLFAKEGAKVVVADVDEASAKETVDEIKQNKWEASYVQVDVSKSSDVQKMMETTIRLYRRIDILVNNAGIHLTVNGRGSVLDIDEGIWDKMMGVNLKGVFLGCKYAIPFMIKQGGGCIINMASVNGIDAYYSETAYDTSKGGVILLTKDIALDFGQYNIRSNCICPGLCDTPLVQKLVREAEDPEKYLKENVALNAAFKRIIKPAEVANVALFLASDEASAMTGSAVVVDAGYTAI